MAQQWLQILFITSAFPGTLLPASIIQISVLLSTLFLSVPLGSYLDAHDRLHNLRRAILTQRATVVLSCIGYFLLNLDTRALARWVKAVIFLIVVVLAIGEKLAGKANMLTMERDWVPTLCYDPISAERESDTLTLTRVNATMRRIDLACKLFAPVAMSAITAGSSFALTDKTRPGGNTKRNAELSADMTAEGVRVTILFIACTALVSSFMEWGFAAAVYHGNPRLQTPKAATEDLSASDTRTDEAEDSNPVNWSKKIRQAWSTWSCSEMYLPSIALALLYTSTLAFHTSLITYLLNASFTLTSLTIARAVSSLVELSSTALMPIGVVFITEAARRKSRYERLIQDDVGESQLSRASTPEDVNSGSIERVGLWGIWWEVLNLLPATALLFNQWQGSFGLSPLAQKIAFFSFLALSRLGLWTFDLSVSQLSQTLIPLNQRGEISGVEVALCSLAELAQFIATAVRSNPSDFRLITTGTTTLVLVAALVFSLWVRLRRGHLLHLDKLRCGAEKPRT